MARAKPPAASQIVHHRPAAPVSLEVLRISGWDKRLARSWALRMQTCNGTAKHASTSTVRAWITMISRAPAKDNRDVTTVVTILLTLVATTFRCDSRPRQVRDLRIGPPKSYECRSCRIDYPSHSIRYTILLAHQALLHFHSPPALPFSTIHPFPTSPPSSPVTFKLL
jgi:hypothetical protein